MSNLRKLSEEEMTDLVQKIGKSTFEHLVREININLLEKTDIALPINIFISIVLSSIASIDANVLIWIEAFYKARFGKDIDFDKLRIFLYKNLNEQLGIEIH